MSFLFLGTQSGVDSRPVEGGVLLQIARAIESNIVPQGRHQLI